MTNMNRYSTNEAAKLLGITGTSLVRYMKAGKIPMPEIIKAGRSTVHSWSEEEVEKLRQLLPKIANGRKTRWQRQREKQRTPARVPQPQHAKTARAGGPKAVPHKARKPKKK